MNEVTIETLDNLFKKYLAIPEYQRPYTWGSKNIDKMINDFKEHLKYNKNQQYYMGAILLHNENDKKFNIIDGQQRITTLLLLAIFLKKDEFQQNIYYDNLQSQKKLKENYNYLKASIENNSLDFEKILEKICFTVIVTNNIDDAFTFFDTQNSSGVQPSVLVLLKAYNLRCINTSSTQIECAKSWDEHERHELYKLTEKTEKLEWLIKIFFYRVRNWRGNKKSDFGHYDIFRDNFTKNMRKAENQEYILYPNIKNKRIFGANSEMTIKAKNMDWFDFAVRQPIYQGEGFFKFLNHYSSLLDELMEIEIHKGKKFKNLLELYRTGSVYMASFMTMVILTYYERFGNDGLSHFINKIDTIIKNIRVSSSRILKQTLEIHFIRCENKNIEQNILDYLCSAFDSQEVLEWLGKIPTEEYSELSGVRKRFDDKHKEFWGINNGK